MNIAVQAVYELATLGRLTPETDYAVRDELDLVSDEERKEHEESVKSDETPKPAASVKKGN